MSSRVLPKVGSWASFVLLYINGACDRKSCYEGLHTLSLYAEDNLLLCEIVELSGYPRGAGEHQYILCMPGSNSGLWNLTFQSVNSW